MVAPPARGWSPNGPVWTGEVRGCPACAGMVPGRCPPASGSSRLPRLRGDGPEPDLSASLAETVAPPARGWSPDADRETRARLGCPACAGMVPSRWKPRRSAGRLPRLRGDGPCPQPAQRRDSPVAPPARGWSREGRLANGLESGCPACAGMVPISDIIEAVIERLPRQRGDGPFGYFGCPSRSSREALCRPPRASATTLSARSRRGRPCPSPDALPTLRSWVERPPGRDARGGAPPLAAAEPLTPGRRAIENLFRNRQILGSTGGASWHSNRPCER